MSTPPDLPRKKSGGRSCLLYGCLTMVALVLVGIVAVYLFVRSTINSAIDQFTATEPVPLEEVVLEEGERAALDEKLGGFKTALDDTNQVATLTLDGREVNAIIASDDRFGQLRDAVRVQLEGDGFQCEVSIPLDPFSRMPFMSRLEGRHLNAHIGVRLAIADGNLTSQITGVRVNDLVLPPEVVDQIEEKMPWEELRQSPEMQKLIAEIDWLKVEDGQLKMGRDAAGE